MDAPVTIRRAGRMDTDDVAWLNAIVQELHHAARPDIFREAGTKDQRRVLEDWLHESGVFVYLAMHGGRPVGYVLARRADLDANAFVRARRPLLLDQIAVDPSARRRGIGAALVARVKELAAELEAPLELNVFAFNETAQTFFASQGFVPRHTLMEAQS